MDNSTFWWQGAAVDPGPGPGPGPDAGDPIGQSLRFRGAQHLTRNVPDITGPWTMSLWVKRAKLGSTQFAFQFGDGKAIFFDADDIFSWQPLAVKSTRVCRDPSAWMHLLFLARPAQFG